MITGAQATEVECNIGSHNVLHEIDGSDYVCSNGLAILIEVGTVLRL